MAIQVWSGVRIGTVGAKLKRIIDLYPGRQNILYVTSAYRPGDGGHHGGLNYGGSPTAAIDVGFSYPNNTDESYKMARWLYQFSGDTVELIHANSRGGSYVKNQSRVGPYAAADHWNHIHFAASSAQADRILKKIGSSSGGVTSGGSTASATKTKNTPYRKRPVIRRGNSGGAVLHLQDLLRKLGYKIDKFPEAPYGPQTENAVKAFQKKHSKLQNDGVVGPNTWTQLEVDAAQKTSAGSRPVIREGDKGAWVGYAQHALRQAGHKIDEVEEFPFGPQTAKATLAAQKKYPWSGPDSIVGKETWIVLDALEKGQTPKDPSGGSSSSGSSGDSSSDPGGSIPAAIHKLKDDILELAADHGLDGVKYGGIAPGTQKAYGYHNSRARHESDWSDRGTSDYSIQTAPDKQGDPLHFSAIDLTGTAQTVVMTKRLKEATEKNDPRLRHIREFYGSLDNEVVFGRTHSSEGGAWGSSTADDSHLWHVHISFFRKYANDQSAVDGVRDVLLGVPQDADPTPEPEPEPEPIPEPEPEPDPVDENKDRLVELIEELIKLLQKMTS